jgi:hypothetical protein
MAPTVRPGPAARARPAPTIRARPQAQQRHRTTTERLGRPAPPSSGRPTKRGRRAGSTTAPAGSGVAGWRPALPSPSPLDRVSRQAPVQRPTMARPEDPTHPPQAGQEVRPRPVAIPRLGREARQPVVAELMRVLPTQAPARRAEVRSRPERRPVRPSSAPPVAAPAALPLAETRVRGPVATAEGERPRWVRPVA